MTRLFEWFQYPPVTGQSSIIIIRIMAGAVFFFEGILKFVYTNQGVGRFTKLGFPFPEATAHIIATGEIIGGLLLLFGLFTRYISFYFIIQMIVAVLSTKIALYWAIPRCQCPRLLLKWAYGLLSMKQDQIMLKFCAACFF